jgi:hypothetical protein
LANASDQPNAVTVALNKQAIAIVFDFVQPIGDARDPVDLVGRQNSNLR